MRSKAIRLKEEMVGPKTGKSSTNKGRQMPIHRRRPFVKTTVICLLSFRNVHPRLNPSNPVVKGKMINSLGSIRNNNRIVRMKVKIPDRKDIKVTIIIGAVAKGLMTKPMAGSKPPADWKMVASAAINAMNSSFFVGVH
jgi:hypothetical protein